MKTKDEVVLERLQKAVQQDNVKYTILSSGGSGIIEDFFSEDSIEKGYYVVSMIDTISIHIRLELLRNVNNEKVRIVPTPKAFIKEGESKLYRNFMKQHEITRAHIKNRVAIIMGLAISSLLPGSEFALYIGNEYKKNIVYLRFSSTIVKDIPINVFSSEDDINNRISAVFSYLWFNDINDYTGYDREIVEFSLRNWDKIR